MATIDYKQKIKDYMNSSEVDTLYKNMLNNLFPELKESEDERIRKDIIWCLKHSGIKESNPINPHVTTITKDAIAWLEKQYEKKVSEYDIVKTIKERIIEHFDNHLIIDKCFSIGGLKDDILKIINEVKFARQGEPTDILDDAVLDSNKDGLIADTIRCKIEEQGEQKPAWSEEDEKIWEEISDLLWEGYKQSGSKFSWDDIRNWINPKLKSLRPQNRWKPSDEQMKMVDEIINILSQMQLFGGRNALIDLKHDLEKLREE